MMAEGKDTFLSKVHDLTSPSEAKELYDKWGPEYDADLRAEGYTAPALAVQHIISAGGDVNGSVLDAGCGTGMVGIALSQAGAKQIDGMDISSGMLKVAADTAVYRKLIEGDLSKRLDLPKDAYDVVVCVGTLTAGHVGPDPALKEFVRITRKNGIVVATVLDRVYTEGGYKAEIARLEDDGLVKVVSTEKVELRQEPGLEGRMVVLKKK